MEKAEYYFYEWLIVKKRMSEEEFDALTDAEMTELRQQFIQALKTAVIIPTES